MPWSKYGVFLFSWCQVFAKEIQTSKDYPKVWLNHKNISADLLTNDGKIEINECMKIVSHRLVGIFFPTLKTRPHTLFPTDIIYSRILQDFQFFSPLVWYHLGIWPPGVLVYAPHVFVGGWVFIAQIFT